MIGFRGASIAVLVEFPCSFFFVLIQLIGDVLGELSVVGTLGIKGGNVRDAPIPVAFFRGRVWGTWRMGRVEGQSLFDVTPHGLRLSFVRFIPR